MLLACNSHRLEVILKASTFFTYESDTIIVTPTFLTRVVSEKLLKALCHLDGQMNIKIPNLTLVWICITGYNHSNKACK